MTEGNLSEVTPPVDNGTPKTFQISGKTSNTWLNEHRRELTTWDFRHKLADDIIANARELTSEVAWGEILDNVIWITSNRNNKGRAAIATSVATAVGSVAREMGWNMDSPQVVYMSGLVFVNFLGRRLAHLGELVKGLEEGKGDFPNEEIKEERLKERKAECARLGTFSHRITGALESYAGDNLPEATDPQYREILDRLLFIGHTSMALIKDRALTAFKRGNFEQAVSELNSPPKKVISGTPFS